MLIINFPYYLCTPNLKFPRNGDTGVKWETVEQRAKKIKKFNFPYPEIQLLV